MKFTSTKQVNWENAQRDDPMWKQLKPGTQILYVPNHAEGDLNHPDVEIGFVTSYRPKTETVFCRYFSKHRRKDLRTKANSEGTPLANIVIKDSAPQNYVNMLLAQIVEDQFLQNARKPY